MRNHVELTRNDRRGMTLIEIMISLVIFGFVMAGALGVLRAESRSFQLGAERIAMYQNSRFAMNELEKDLRTSGAGAPDIQPQMIYINDSVMVFNANYWTNTSGDVEAVYYNPDAPDSAVVALRASTKVTIPYTNIQYPDTNYLSGALNSQAETIMFYFVTDSGTSRTDDYILWRRINRLAPEIVATSILKTSGEPFFEYFKLTTPAGGGTGTVLQVSSGLPWRHTVPIHLSIGDTGTLARIDSIRAVRVNFTVTNGKAGTAERKRTLTRYIRMPNAGLANTKSCGDAPIFSSTVTATNTVGGGGAQQVTLTWSASVDEATGEKDVERYEVWRKLSAATEWGDTYVTVGSAGSSYTFIDSNVSPGLTYVYAVAAQDCTPTLSPLRTSNNITIP